MAPLDPFAEAFDSIPLRTAYADEADQVLGAPTAWERGEDAAPSHEAPGHYLIDDADGRFRVDPVSGLIELTDPALLETERNAIHAARLRVVEASGEAYEMTLRLQITGLIPHICGHAGFAGAAAAPRAAWRDFGAYRAELAERGAPPSPRARFGAALAEAPFDAFDVDLFAREAALTLDHIPSLVAWSL